jgi:hypothetical protein
MLHQSMVDLYPSENLNAWNLLSVQHFVYKLLFHVHCYNTCFYLHDQFSVRKFILVRHGTLRILSWWAEPIHIWIWMPNMKNLLRFHAFKFSDGYKSTMDWCSVSVLSLRSYFQEGCGILHLCAYPRLDTIT